MPRGGQFHVSPADAAPDEVETGPGDTPEQDGRVGEQRTRHRPREGGQGEGIGYAARAFVDKHDRHAPHDQD